ncbi:Os08g0427100 [Oryza sativa Japonica Group]|uniref:Os08g0427100 protein n=1 Tax=Oryza sativa subsp. japonica TaxID=39947 RepID=A0A0P0XG60_ORYSJ|nr:hypothetical protein EE612_044380 [Oryza sativa]BAT05513.1 Os08g0427100 [Oryza sativa Japonica Group]
MYTHTLNHHPQIIFQIISIQIHQSFIQHSTHFHSYIPRQSARCHLVIYMYPVNNNSWMWLTFCYVCHTIPTNLKLRT